MDNGTAIVDEMVRIHLLCSLGSRLALAFGKKRYGAICNASKFTSLMPAHKNIGKKNYNAIERKDQKYDPLMRHFKYLKNLGEVRSTQVVATLVDRIQGHEIATTLLTRLTSQYCWDIGPATSDTWHR